LPRKLELQLSAAKQYGACIIYSRFHEWLRSSEGSYPTPEYVDDGVVGTLLDPTLSGWIYPDLLLDSHVHIITALVHRSVFDRVGVFDESLSTGSDYEFWIRASRTYPMYRLQQTLALYRIRPNSITFTPQSRNNRYDIIQNAIARYGLTGPDGRRVDGRRLRRRLARSSMEYGTQLWRAGMVERALKPLTLSLRHDPTYLNGWKALTRYAWHRCRRRRLP
jgi:hypothetical protein